ncbi:MAG: MerR family transcriptional regulator [Burkholderiaceae bacterium]|nr:MerR family transcriptional regulator [Burkholderiaceae bacterium]
MQPAAPFDMTIADVERDTGLGKDTLRVWERRYGFPQPQRDAQGERRYAAAEVEKLRTIKRLIDAGHRPGRLVTRTLGELKALGDNAATGPGEMRSVRGDEVDALLQLVARHDADALRHALAGAEARHGLRAFVVDVVAPLTRRVGESWMRGELRVFEEHLFTEAMQAVLHAALSSLPPARYGPRVLFATLPGEPHGLGLLMAQAVIALEDCPCLSLGVQVPVADIAAAARAWRANIAAISATACMKRSLLLESLAQLRLQLPPDCALWVGGAAPVLDRHSPDGVVRVPTLEAIDEALQPWRCAE